MATCNGEFPITEWDRLLPQAEMTLNMMRPARCNPKMSAYAYIYGPHNFAATPLAPAGTKVIVHMKPEQRSSWAYHGKVGWYVGPSHEHYRCFRCFLPCTGREIITDTVKFIPSKVQFPKMTLEQHLKNAVEKIINILQESALTNLPTTAHK